jgi:hypothetical protein
MCVAVKINKYSPIIHHMSDSTLCNKELSLPSPAALSSNTKKTSGTLEGKNWFSENYSILVVYNIVVSSVVSVFSRASVAAITQLGNILHISFR